MPFLGDYPLLVAQLDRARNGALAAGTIKAGSHRRLWWRCLAGPDHVWAHSVNRRALRGDGCPFCAGKRVSVTNGLATVLPALAAEWHPTKNGQLTPWDVALHARRTAWWKCPEGDDHEWRSAIHGRTRAGARGSCPFCVNRRLSKTNSLATRFPKIAAQWHPTKNGQLTPTRVVAVSSLHAFWRCPFGHEWRTRICQRTYREAGCPHCRRRRQPVATTGKTRRRVHLARYEGARHSTGRKVG